MIKLGRLRFQNFKSFSAEENFDFTDKGLVLFEGPNGFGKTTIFDAIEICFLGKVSRIFNSDYKNKEGHVLKSSNEKETKVFLELMSDKGVNIVICAYIPLLNSGADCRVSNINKTIQRYKLGNWDEINNFEPSTARTLNVEELKGLLGNDKLESTFSIFNYIQQEETNRFLKINESNRHKTIDFLFGTYKESKQLEKINNVKEIIKSKLSQFNQKQIELERKIKEIASSETQSDQIGSKEVKLSNKIEPLRGIESKPYNQLKSYYNHVQNLLLYMKNKRTFQDIEFNRLLDILVNQRENELKNILKLGMVKDYKRIERLKKSQAKWMVISSNISRFEKLIDSKPKKLNYESVEYLNLISKLHPKLSSNYKSYLLQFAETSQLLNGHEKTLSLIQESRENLLKHYQTHSKDKESKINCPFCGLIKKNWEQLLDEYTEQSIVFKSLISDESKTLEELGNVLLNEVVNSAIDKMEKYIEKYKKFSLFKVSRFFQAKIIDINEFNKMKKVQKWLDKNKIEYQKYMDKQLLEINEDYSLKIPYLKNSIESNLRVIDPSIEFNYQDVSTSLRSLNLDYKSSIVFPFNVEDVSNDLEYISNLLLSSNSKVHQELLGDKIYIEKKITLLSRELEPQINKISKIYSDQIKKYESLVAKQIAIPLYVYSSKILQSRLEGDGIFLKTPESQREKNPFLRFCSDKSNPHDAYNTMSSGQLAGVIISFMLAMNKTFPTDLGTLLIDDPVQTMDEINMASLVQVLRTEFSDKQILLSTHENNVSTFIGYKYRQANRDIRQYNLKNIKLKS